MPIDPDSFAKQCIRGAEYCGVWAHYMIMVAKIRSNISDDTQNGLVGPFRLAQDDWNKFRSDTEFAFDYSPADIGSWRAQCAVFALMTHRAADGLLTKLGRNPSAAELFVAQWPANDLQSIVPTLKANLDATSDLISKAALDLGKDRSRSAIIVDDPTTEIDSADRPTSGASSELLSGDGSFRFTAQIVGDDIEVHGVVATWFGGPDDPSDSGTTASGISTKDNPDIVGCALPMDGFANPKTDGSPIPRLPWKTPVVVTNTETGVRRTFPLIDLGPSKFAGSHAAIDLTKAAFRAIGGDPDRGILRVDFSIPGAAHEIKGAAGNSVSLGKVEKPVEPIGPGEDGHGISHGIAKPSVKFIESPNCSSRNGTNIDMIVMHYTDGPSAQGAINRFLNPAEQVSAHYIIERDGTIYQMVRDTDKAWHAKAANPRSIGIEHVALPGQRMGPAQETSSIALLRWLMATYGIERANVVGHRYAPGNENTTDCPDHLFGNANRQAVVDWVNIHFPEEVAGTTDV